MDQNLQDKTLDVHASEWRMSTL